MRSFYGPWAIAAAQQMFLVILKFRGLERTVSTRIAHTGSKQCHLPLNKLALLAISYMAREDVF